MASKPNKTIPVDLSKMAPLFQLVLSKAAESGRDGDTNIVHVNDDEIAALKAMGGRGTVNPKTGLLEFSPMGGQAGGVDGTGKQKDGSLGGGNGGGLGGNSNFNGGGKFGKGSTQTGGLGGGTAKSTGRNGGGKFGKGRTQTGGLSQPGKNATAPTSGKFGAGSSQKATDRDEALTGPGKGMPGAKSTRGDGMPGWGDVLSNALDNMMPGVPSVPEDVDEAAQAIMDAIGAIRGAPLGPMMALGRAMGAGATQAIDNAPPGTEIDQLGGGRRSAVIGGERYSEGALSDRYGRDITGRSFKDSQGNLGATQSRPNKPVEKPVAKPSKNTPDKPVNPDQLGTALMANPVIQGILSQKPNNFLDTFF